MKNIKIAMLSTNGNSISFSHSLCDWEYWYDNCNYSVFYRCISCKRFKTKYSLCEKEIKYRMNANSDIHLGKYELKHMHDCKTHI